MFSEEQYATSLAKFLSDFDYAIVDTCSLMDDAFPKWMDILHGAKDYLNDDLRIIVPRECFEELKKHAKNKEDAGKRIAAKSAIKIIRRAKWSKLLEVGKKEGEKNFADHVIYVKASTDRLDKKILIITQDKKLATDLLHLNNLASQRGRRVRVCKIGVDGTLVPNHGEYPKQGEKLGNKPVLEREKKALFGNKKKPQEKPKKAESDNNEIVSADSKLQSTIPNGTYPIEKKIEDITHQINAMSKLSTSSLPALKLTYDLPALQKLLSQLKSEKAKKEKDKTSPSPTEAKKQQPKPKDQPTKAEKPVQEQQKKEQPKKPDLGWYEKGSNLKAAITKVCEHHGVLVRDPGIAYDKQAHGEVDFTSKDVGHVSELLQNGISGGDVFQSTYRGWLVAGQKVSDEMFKVWINFKSKAPEPAKKASKPAEPDKPEPKKEKPKKEQEPQIPEPSKPTSKKQKAKKGDQPKQTTEPNQPNPAAEQPKAPEPKGAQPKPTEPKPAAKPEKPAKSKGAQPRPTEPKPESKPTEPKPEAKPEKPAKPKKPAKPEKPANEAKKDETSASNAGAVLIVAEPAKKKPVKKAKPAAAKPVEEKPAAEKPKATKDVKPSEPKAKKPVPEKAKKEPEPKKATKAPKKAEKPAEAPAKQKPEPKKEVKPDAFALAQAADKRLKANITNPTYPNENKVKDIEAQIDLVKKLKPEERDELNYGLDALKAMLAMSK